VLADDFAQQSVDALTVVKLRRSSGLTLLPLGSNDGCQDRPTKGLLKV